MSPIAMSRVNELVSTSRKWCFWIARERRAADLGELFYFVRLDGSYLVIKRRPDIPWPSRSNWRSKVCNTSLRETSQYIVSNSASQMCINCAFKTPLNSSQLGYLAYHHPLLTIQHCRLTMTVSCTLLRPPCSTFFVAQSYKSLFRSRCSSTRK